MLRALTLATMLLVLPWESVFADPPPDLDANAALRYWQAFAQLPKFTDAQEHKLRDEYLTMPLDAHARDLVARSDYAFRMMHRAAAMPRCAWGLSLDEGIELLLPHAQAARTLATLACLRARIRFAEGRNEDAVADILDAMTVGRHVSVDGSLITVLVNYAIERQASETLALDLSRLDAQAIRNLKTRLVALPPPGSPARALVSFEEKAGLDWWIRKIQEDKDKEGLLAFLGAYCSRHGDSPEQGRERGRAFLEECGGTWEDVVKMAEETRPCYSMAAKMLELPLDACEKQFEDEARKRAGNPVFKLLFPPVPHLRLSQARADVHRALLAAALDVQLDDPDALKSHPDPAAGGPFELVTFEGGFELRSKFKPKDGHPWTLVVGRRGN
jgi:hypothetical protein